MYYNIFCKVKGGIKMFDTFDTQVHPEELELEYLMLEEYYGKENV